jgi:hypothetical protein
LPKILAWDKYTKLFLFIFNLGQTQAKKDIVGSIKKKAVKKNPNSLLGYVW